jgi:hypothetical protein
VVVGFEEIDTFEEVYQQIYDEYGQNACCAYDYFA